MVRTEETRLLIGQNKENSSANCSEQRKLVCLLVRKEETHLLISQNRDTNFDCQDLNESNYSRENTFIDIDSINVIKYTYLMLFYIKFVNSVRNRRLAYLPCRVGNSLFGFFVPIARFFTKKNESLFCSF